MSKDSNVKFIRVNGHVVPIKNKGPGQPNSPRRPSEKQVHQATLNEISKKTSVVSKAFNGVGFGAIGAAAGFAAGVSVAAAGEHVAKKASVLKGLGNKKLGAALMIGGAVAGAYKLGKFGVGMAGVDEKSYYGARKKVLAGIRKKNKSGV